MDVRVQDPSSSPDLENSVDGKSAEPGWQAWAVLAGGSLADFLQLLKVEAEIALRLLPGMVTMSVARVPLLLLTWLSFGILAASIAYTLTEMVLAAAATFFALQVIASLVLEAKLKRAQQQSSLPESRKAFAMVMHTLNDQVCDGLAARFTATEVGGRRAQSQSTQE